MTTGLYIVNFYRLNGTIVGELTLAASCMKSAKIIAKNKCPPGFSCTIDFRLFDSKDKEQNRYELW
jgi:hypothetical protein